MQNQTLRICYLLRQSNGERCSIFREMTDREAVWPGNSVKETGRNKHERRFDSAFDTISHDCKQFQNQT